MIVIVKILQRIDSVFARSNTLDDKTSITVSTSDTHQGLLAENGVRQIIIQSDRNTLDGLQIAGINDIACHLEGINLLTGREGKGIVAHRISLVIVRNGIAEVNGIGGIGLQAVL